MRLMQHKKEAFWFYRFLSVFYDDLVNPLFWTVPMREKALQSAGLEQPDRHELKVLDVGSGTGFTTEGIIEYVRPHQVTCVDQSPHQMERAKSKKSLIGVTFQLGDAEHLALPTSYYDRYVSAGSIEYWPHPAQGIREAYRVVKPGGMATIIGPIEPPTVWGRFLANTWMLFPKEQEYRRWYEQAGFKNLQISYLDPSWYTGNSHFALAITGTKPVDGSAESPDIAEDKDLEEQGLGASAKTFARVAIGAAAGGAFIPMALGAKVMAKLRGKDDPRESLNTAQKSVLLGLGIVAAGAVAVWLTRQTSVDGLDDRWPESPNPRPDHHLHNS